MIGIFVNHDRVRVPIPVGHIRVIERIDAKVCIIEPEPRAIAALQVKYVARPETKTKSSVCVRVVEVIVPLVYVTVVVPDPLAVRMHVRRVRVFGNIAIVPLLSFPSMLNFPLLRGFPRLRGRALLLSLPLRAVGRYIAAANMVSVLFLTTVLILTTATVLFPIAPSFLSVRRDHQGYRERGETCDFVHKDLLQKAGNPTANALAQDQRRTFSNSGTWAAALPK
jgi:hypothetical protein